MWLFWHAGANLAQIEQNTLFHVWDKIKHAPTPSGEEPQEPQDPTAASHLGVFVDYLNTAFGPIIEHLSALLEKNEITYDLLWALFEPNAEVYTTCNGTGAPRCVLFNYCEERREMTGQKYMYLQTRYLHSDGKVLGEVTTGIKIPHFVGTKLIEHLGAYPLRHHPERDEIRETLIQCGRTFVSLIGIHHRQYEGKAFFIDIDNDNEIVARHIKGRIMVDAACFQERMPNYPCPRVQNLRPKYSRLGRCDVMKPSSIDPERAEESELLICSATVYGFCLSSKQFRSSAPDSRQVIHPLIDFSRVRCI